MGDGQTVTCTKMSTYSEAVRAGSPSPTCGHTYTKPSLPKGTYTVRTTSNWDVDWSVAGFSGTVPAYNTGSASIPIGELSAPRPPSNAACRGRHESDRDPGFRRDDAREARS
jgi:hypothetical protein